MATENIEAIKKKFTITIDKSNAKRDFTHFFAIWLWIGWTFFYLAFTLLLPILYLYSKKLLTVIIGLMIISIVSPVDRKSQPKWGYAIGDWILLKANEYFRIKMIVEDVDALKSSGNAIFAMEPHG